MKRREFIVALGGVAAWPAVARGQQSAMPMIGFLGVSSLEKMGGGVLLDFKRGLAETGYVEGRNLVIDLTDATAIDRDGEAAIFELMQGGAKFCCSGVLTKHVLKRLAGKCHTGLSDVMREQRVRSEKEG